MKKILLVQRDVTHYRKLLIEYIESRGECLITPVCISDGQSAKGDKAIRVPAITLFEYRGRIIRYSKAMVSYVKNHYSQYDYIILEGATNLINNIPICRYLHKEGIPYIVWDAGRRKNAEMTILRRLMQRKLEFIWKNAAAIIAYSTIAKQYFVNLGISEEQVFICQNTLYVDTFDKQIAALTQEDIKSIRQKYAPKQQKIILYVGVIEKRKRVTDLVDAFEIVKNKHKDVVLLIIGGGDYFKELTDYCIGKEDIFLLGPIIEGVIKYFMAADLFVLPSQGGLSINQAMICSKPVIASSADGTELDLIEQGKNGFLFEEKNIDELVDRIDEVISDDEKLVSMGQHSRMIIEERINEKTFYDNFKKCINSVKKSK